MLPQPGAESVCCVKYGNNLKVQRELGHVKQFLFGMLADTQWDLEALNICEQRDHQRSQELQVATLSTKALALTGPCGEEGREPTWKLEV